MIHMPHEWLDITKQILADHIPDRKVLAFGSRVSGAHLKPHSDIDLCILGDAPVADPVMRALREAFSASQIPVRVDILNWSEVSPILRDNIMEFAEPVA